LAKRLKTETAATGGGREGTTNSEPPKERKGTIAVGKMRWKDFWMRLRGRGWYRRECPSGRSRREEKNCEKDPPITGGGVNVWEMGAKEGLSQKHKSGGKARTGTWNGNHRKLTLTQRNTQNTTTIHTTERGREASEKRVNAVRRAGTRGGGTIEGTNSVKSQV